MGYVLLKASGHQGPTGSPGPGPLPGTTGATATGGPSGPTYSSSPESLTSCSRVVISFWFRLPQASITLCKEAYAEWKARDDAEHEAGNYGVVPPQFNGIIPLLTFGQDTERKNIGTKAVPGKPYNYQNYQWLGGYIGCRWDYMGPNPVTPVLFQQEYDGKFDFRTSPSYIGIDCKPLVADGESIPAEPLPKLVFCIQTSEKAETSGGTNSLTHQLSEDTTDIDFYEIEVKSLVDEESGCEWPPGHVMDLGPPGPIGNKYWLDPISEASTTITVEPSLLLNEEVFQTLPGPYTRAKTVGHSVPVTANRWHHVLLSFDLTFPCKTKGRMEKTYDRKPGTIESAPQLYIAFDGRNLTKKRLSHYWPVTGQPNDFISVNAKMVYDSNVYPAFQGTRPYNGQGTLHYQTVVGEAAAEISYTFKPLNMLPVGLPSTDLYVNHIRHVEMAELQIFPGVVLDTSVRENREPFIRGGKPVPPDQKPTEANKWKPGSIEFLKMQPEVLLHGTKKWQKGDNTGSGAELTTAGNIQKYVPDPSLGGPQGDPQ